jgi:pimeloyl-ACP methyl ester carboxylesterase
MKRIYFVLVAIALAFGLSAFPALAASTEAGGTDEIITITSFDGMKFDGRLRLPAGDKVDKIVIYVNGSGPNTYDNRRLAGDLEFRYHDLFAQQLNERGVGYFSYNTRGVTPGDEPPMYCAIDEEAYQTYKPTNEIKDIACVIDQLKALDALKDAQVILLGWSAGAMIAPQVALAGDAQVDLLVLAGYPNDTMADILEWQLTGGSSMVFYRQYFDADQGGAISREEYEADPSQIISALGNYTFDQLDLNADGTLTAADFGKMLKDMHDQVFQAFESGNDAWLKANYPVELTSLWYLDYANIAPNSETLPKLDLPILIFQGTYDQNTPVEGAQSIEQAFQSLGKDNLTVHIYPADHDLNYMSFVATGQIPQPIVEMLDAIAAF